MHYITEQLTFSTWLSQHGRVVETHLFKFLFHFSDGMLDATHLHGARVVHTKSIGGKGGGGGGAIRCVQNGGRLQCDWTGTFNVQTLPLTCTNSMGLEFQRLDGLERCGTNPTNATTHIRM